ncbi:MAG: DUF4113 domain-containing protein, partial [Candidatus Cryptobacteroides sp.]
LRAFRRWFYIVLLTGKVLLNCKYGVKTVRLAVEGGKDEKWKVRCEHRTPNCLTDLNELLTVNI